MVAEYGIGYADGADGGISGITSGQLEVKYTLYGDTNLDGAVNSVDFGNLAANFGKSNKVWDQGDFNYDGTVNSIDFGLLAGNFGKSVGSNADVVTSADWAALDAFAAANGLTAEVPEPATTSLVAVGLNVAILLPALNKARQQAIYTQCQSNLRQIGQAILMYSTANQLAIIPAIFWGNSAVSGAPSPADDNWGIALVAQGYLPNPNIAYNADATAASSVLVCPAVRSEILEEDGPAPMVSNTSNANASDGFERRGSWHLSPPVNGVPLIVDVGYTINGTVYCPGGSGSDAPSNGQGLNGEVNFDTYANAFHTGIQYLFDFPCNSIYTGSSGTPMIVHKLTDFHRSANTVLACDGSAWNFMIGRASRVTGQRHGNYNANPPAQWLWSADQSSGYVVNFTGTTNVLFLDGHVEGEPRSALPAAMAQFGGFRDEMVSIPGTAQKLDPTIIWNIKQQY